MRAFGLRMDPCVRPRSLFRKQLERRTKTDKRQADRQTHTLKNQRPRGVRQFGSYMHPVSSSYSSCIPNSNTPVNTAVNATNMTDELLD